jgi:beta-lactamase regulating signal transducer with metallopeptidase domain
MGPLGNSGLPATTATFWPNVAIALWLTVAAALLCRAFLLGWAGMRLALSGACDVNARDLATLARACGRANVKGAIRLVRSPYIATPVTAGIFRPTIVIPAGTHLGDEELETILTHECAHVARHDNVLGIVESVASCALWFHPLAWIARRLLDAAREEACDAVVIDSGDAGVYVTALRIVCGAAVAPHPAGIYCIVSNTINERMEAIMHSGKRRLLPHRVITAVTITLLAAATISTGVARALPASGNDAPPTSRTPATPATPISPVTADENISLDLRDAEIHDVMRTFAQLTRITIVVDSDVSGSVTISVHDMPWKEAFAKILDDTNLRQEQAGSEIHVHRK